VPVSRDDYGFAPLSRFLGSIWSGASVHFSILTVTAAEGVRAAVIAGQGFAISSRWMFAPELETGEVVSILEGWSLPPVDLWSFTHPVD
jgi:DNA-binding transcriptional LysR family regulator